MHFLRYMVTLSLAGAVCIACFANPGDFDGGENGTGTYLRQLSEFSARKAIHGALFFQVGTVAFYGMAVQQGLDVSGVVDLIAEADALWAEAQACFEKGDFSCARCKAIDAIFLYKEVSSILNALLAPPDV